MAHDSSEADAGLVFNEKEFVLRHKTEAHNMFGLMDHLLGRQDHYTQALDMGGGYGDHLPFIMDRVGSVISVDILDYFDESVFSPREVAYRSQKYGGSMPLDRVAFHRCDAQNLIYRESLFDLVFSINAFEHIPNPVLALGEALRVARVGAPIYIQFDPIWNSPSGHHLPHLNFEPWQHLLVDEAEFSRLILSKGGTEKDVHVFSTAMNRRSFSYYERMFREDFSERFLSPTLTTWCRDAKDEPASQHPNFQRCLSRGYRVEELITRGVQFFGVKAW